jgi:membrane protein insertase Oxa1/YidC/SpoIIIJ
MPSTIVDLFRGALFALAHWCGGSFGTAIIVAGVGLRILTLPISLRAARRNLVRQAQLRAIAPELAALKRRYAGELDKLAVATQRLYEERGIALVDRASLVDSLLLYPPAAALYATIRAVPRGVGRFLWMSDLATPDRMLATIAAFVSAAIAWAAVSTSGDSGRAAQFAPIVGALITFAILSHISAGVALYSITTSLIGGAEQALARRTLRQQAP